LPSACAAISDPVSIILAKRLHHQYLMELHIVWRSTK
jgi:hypothetical protein